MSETVKKKASKLGINNRREKIFYSLFIAIPVIHFLVFYVYINFNSILLAFQEHDLVEGGYEIRFAKWKNFATAWENSFGGTAGWIRIKNSFLMMGILMVTGMPLAVLFSYYLYKRAPFSSFFKTMLFMPQLLSGVVLGILFIELTNTVYLGTIGKGASFNLLVNHNTKFGMVVLFNILMGFGVNVLMYTSTMSGINESLIESAQLDGANALQELWYIVLPMVYPTLTTLFIVSFSHVFTNQFNLFTLYGTAANELGTVGYYLYVQAQSSGLAASEVGDGFLNYSALSAMGLIFTAIILPTTLIARHLLEKYGPKAE